MLDVHTTSWGHLLNRDPGCKANYFGFFPSAPDISGSHSLRTSTLGLPGRPRYLPLQGLYHRLLESWPSRPFSRSLLGAGINCISSISLILTPNTFPTHRNVVDWINKWTDQLKLVLQHWLSPHQLGSQGTMCRQATGASWYLQCESKNMNPGPQSATHKSSKLFLGLSISSAEQCKWGLPYLLH